MSGAAAGKGLLLGEKRLPFLATKVVPPRCPGLIERPRLYERYEELAGIPVPPAAVQFYEAFGTFKLAVIHVGASRCFEDGRFKDLRLATMGVHLPRLALQLEATIEGKT